jgi:hypothetical protein
VSVLSALNLTNARILTPDEAIHEIAQRGEWMAVATAVARLMADREVGSAVRFDSLGLTANLFVRTKATKTQKVGDIDYSAITNAARTVGLLVRPTVDDDRAFVMPADQDAMIAKAKATRAAAAAKAKAKANKK